MTPTREQIERAEQYVSTYCSLTDNTAGEVSTRLHAAVLLHEVRRLRAENAALRAAGPKVKETISGILEAALSGQDESLRICGYIRWGLVEERMWQAIDAALAGGDA